MKIAIYARVSSETQAKEGTIDSQIEALYDYAKKHELTIIHECIDNGISGAHLDRPGLDQLRDLAQEGKIEGILVLSPDRLSRKQAHQIILLEEFKKRNLQVIFTNQQQGDSPEDNLMLQIQGAVSEYERAKIIDRTRRGRIHSVKKGQPLGNIAAYGYSFIQKSETSIAHWEVNPVEAEIVRIIFDLYVNKGLKGTAIAKWLEEKGIPSRSSYQKWYASTVYKIIQNEAYIGTAFMYKTLAVEPSKGAKVKRYRKHRNSSSKDRPREDWIGIPVTPIIDKKLWQRAQELRKQNAYRSRRNNNKNNYLLRGLVLCGFCGSIASGHVSNQKTYYSCGAKRIGNITTKPHEESITIRHPELDNKVWTGLVELLDDPQKIKAQIENRLEAKKCFSNVKDSKTCNNDNDLERLFVQEKRLLDAYREGIISISELKDQKVKIASKLKVLQAKKKTIPSQQERSGKPEITIDMLANVSTRFHRVMAKSDFAAREKLVNLLVNSVTLYPNKAVVEGTIPLIRSDALIPWGQ